MKPMSLMPHVPFSIMVALSLKPRHGYEIMQQVKDDTLGNITLGPGALYGTIKKLLNDNLIEEVPSEKENDRRKLYRLTRKGWDRLTIEMEYYRYVAELARKRHLVSIDNETTDLIFAEPLDSSKK
jgi:DNA-binding PadR family transcriptional regulator